MAAYFIDYITNYSAFNKKGQELQDYIRQFNQRFVPDDLSMDAFKADVENEIASLNEKYPHTIPMELEHYNNGVYGAWMVRVKGYNDKVVFILSWKKVLGTFQFNEKSLSNEKESENSCPATHLSRT